ncbi:MAG: 50S ribosomal protein L11 methyltransferase [Thermomicrobiales bacterium]|nr:50S ribosomal protein L11 methyltransferase [Thermomicrobiales bacterium]
MTEQSTTTTWLQLSVEVDHEAVEPVTELFARYGYNEGVAIEEPFTQDGDGDNLAVDPTRPVWVRTFINAADVDPARLDEIRNALWHLGQIRRVGSLQIEERAEEDWANAWKEHFRPLRAGRKTIIAPPWHEFSTESADDIVVILDPGMAFGTGTHPSSRLCLMGLEKQLERGDVVFDVGTGSGILAIAAVKLGASHVDAVDIEPVAVRSAAENAARNGVAERIRTALGTAEPGGEFQGPYDVVVANIISRVLVELSDGLANAVKPGGLLIMSGVIESREPLVREAFEPRGFRLIDREQIDDWVGLTYRAPL